MSNSRCSRIATLFALLWLTSGCSSEYLNETYGGRSGYGFGSVNGTAVLGEMFIAAGHDVRSWRVMSPSLNDADVIVWFPSDFGAPSSEAQSWLYDWLHYSDEPKTLIYVGRDYEVGPLYWRQAQPLAPASQQNEFAIRERESERAFASARGSAPTSATVEDWFTLDRRNTKSTVKRLQGPWSRDIDASQVELEHRQYLKPDASADILLADGKGHPLVSEILYSEEASSWGRSGSQVILVENGAFLLSGALVNKEHRKLAGKLVNHVGPPELEVVFLEASSSPRIMDSDPSMGPPSGFQLFRIWPIGAVLAQLAALGIVFAMARFPIFGVPRGLETPSLTDFGRHVAAVGRLLAATRDRAYAYAQLRAYFQLGEDASVSSQRSPQGTDRGKHPPNHEESRDEH